MATPGKTTAPSIAQLAPESALFSVPCLKNQKILINERLPQRRRRRGKRRGKLTSVSDLLRLPLRRCAKEVLNQSKPFGLSLSKPLIVQVMPFDKPVLSEVEGLRANGFVQHFPKNFPAK
jgi:hypothetical protein